MPEYMQLGPYFGMHGGYLPGYPASHGCVRMPSDLAAEFFLRVQVGTPVEIVGDARNVTHVRKAIPLIQPGESGTIPPLLIPQPKVSAGSRIRSEQSEKGTANGR